jgi:hypothetical protein
VFKLVDGSESLVLEATNDCCLEGLAIDAEGNLYVADGFLGEVMSFGPDGSVLDAPLAVTQIGGPTALAFGRDQDGSPNDRLFAANGWYNLPEYLGGSIVELNSAAIHAAGFFVTRPDNLLYLSKEALRDGVMGAEYRDTLIAEDATTALTWDLADGALPGGLELNAQSGVISGIPAEHGTHDFVVGASDGDQHGERVYQIEVRIPVLVADDVASAVLGVEGILTGSEVRYLDMIGNGNGEFDIGDFRAFVLGGSSLTTNRVPRREQ